MDKREKVTLGVLGLAAVGIAGYEIYKSSKKTTSTTQPTTTAQQTTTTTTTTSTSTSSSSSIQKTTTTPTTTSTSTSSSSTTSSTSSQQQVLVTIDNNCIYQNIANIVIDITYTDPNGQQNTISNNGYITTIAVQYGSTITLTYKIYPTPQQWSQMSQYQQATYMPSSSAGTLITKTVGPVTQNILIKACQGDTPSLQITPISQPPSQYYNVTIVNSCQSNVNINYTDPFGQGQSVFIPLNGKATVTVKAGTTVSYAFSTALTGSLGTINSNTTLSVPCEYECLIMNSYNQPATFTWQDNNNQYQTVTLRPGGSKIIVTGANNYVTEVVGSKTYTFKCLTG